MKHFRLLMLPVILLAALFLTSCSLSGRESITNIPEAPEDKRLVVYTSHKEEVFEPLVREFEETTGIWVDVVTGGTQELLERIASGDVSEEGCDIMFGGGVESLAAFSECFEPYRVSEYEMLDAEFASADDTYTVFSSLPIVIIYNDKLVYTESAPKGYLELFDERWRGKIAFADPRNSGTSCTALETMIQLLDGRFQDTEALFARQLGYSCLAKSGEVVNAVDVGTKLVGITLEEYALKQKAAGADIEIIYPEEGTSAIPDGIALVKGSKRRENAISFMEFVTGKKAQQYIEDNYYRRSVRLDVTDATGQGAVKEGELKRDIATMDYDLERASREQSELLGKWGDLIR